MSERLLGQMSFADRLVADVARGNATLERIEALVDWDAVAGLLSPLRGGVMGAPGYPALTMFRALLLQRWYGLSDPQLEEALADRLSFRRFVGLSLSEPAPDHSTIWRFREAFGKSGLAERAFAAITQQIETSGFVLKRGTLIDASLIPAAVNPPPPPRHPLPPDADGRPASKLVPSPSDPDAGWTKKEGKHFFGYKVHVGMDQVSRIIRRVAVTPANVNESEVADALICGDEAAVYGDKAFTNKARRARLKAQGIRDGIMMRSNRWRKPSRWMIKRNAIIAHRRAPIESWFAHLKHVCGFARARHRGLLRNAAAIHLAATAINLARWVKNAPAPA
ncbi:MAG: IS5 family transposase [Xanthobacteraceae bacterium]